MEVKIIQALLLRRRTPNKESLGEEIKEKAQGQMIPLWPSKTPKNECPVYLRKKKWEYTSCSSCRLHGIGFHQLWWICSKPTICNILQGFSTSEKVT